MQRAIGTLLVLPCVLAFATGVAAQNKTPIIFDTDIGSDIDDAFALSLILASPELQLRGATAVSGDTRVRALMLCRFLTMTGRRHRAVAFGRAPQPKREIAATGQYRYYYHPDVIFNRTTRPQKESAVDFLYARLKSQRGEITLVAAGPLTNIARLITEKPDCKPWIKQIILAEGSDSNIRADVKAARAVLASGVPLLVVPARVTNKLVLDEQSVRRVFSPTTALSLQVQAMYQLWDRRNPVLADPLSVALCMDERFCKFKNANLAVDENGALQIGNGAPNARIAVSVDGKRFLNWYVERMENCVSPAERPAKVLTLGPFPYRVHVAEDFENDIERFWWMSGKAETKNLPPDSTRACRGTLTHDFDDLLGHTKAMYTAVVFNPVPGPPMGKNTRLSFRYWLKGTDQLRVQISSLTNGYHRNLVLKGLPQGKWSAATVDMTVARRPDGTGGPLSENERIDDIQFYADPRAELLIDDIVLFDAGPAHEKRPFPKHVYFAGGFDTGNQKKHWLGDFDFAPDKGYFWRALQSKVNATTGKHWIRLGLRGERTMSGAASVSFRYRLTGTDGMKVAIVGEKSKLRQEVQLSGLARDSWARTTAAFKLGNNARVAEIHFLPDGDGSMLLDDLVVYQPR